MQEKSEKSFCLLLGIVIFFTILDNENSRRTVVRRGSVDEMSCS